MACWFKGAGYTVHVAGPTTSVVIPARPMPALPPRQTVRQKAMMAGMRARAALASTNATPSVLTILNNTPGSACHNLLAGTAFANTSASMLLQGVCTALSS